MIMLELRRDTRTAMESVGVLSVLGNKFQTIEKPWVPNSFGGKSGEKYVSCISPGIYRLERFTRPSGEKALILSNPSLDVYQFDDDVPAGKEKACRTLCLFHIANYAYEVIGCIGPGMERVKETNRWMVTKSRQAMNTIRTLIGSDLDIKLHITEGFSNGDNGGNRQSV